MELTSEFCTRLLGQDYDFLARADARYGYGTYVAGVRKASAPPLPEDVKSGEDYEFAPDGEQRIWTLTGGGETIYRFILGKASVRATLEWGAAIPPASKERAARRPARTSSASSA